MPTSYHRFYRKHTNGVVVALVLAALALLGGYNLALHTQQEDRRAASCSQVATLYATLVKLVRIDADHFTPADVQALQRQMAERVAACKRAP